MGTLGVVVAAWFITSKPAVPVPLERDAAGRQELPASYDEAYEQLVGLAPLPGRSAVVRQLVLRRDAAEFRLAEGDMYLLSPVAGRIVGAVFLGQGSVSLTPPLQVERRELERLYDTPSLERDFSELVLLFADGTLAELEATLVFEERPLPLAAAASVEQALAYLHEEDEEEFYAPIMTAVLNGHRNQLFYAQFSERNRDPMFFVIDPYAVEGVRIMRDGDDDTHEIVCQFARAGAEGRVPAEGPPPAALATIEHYVIESTIGKDVEFEAAAEMTVVSHAPDLHWIYLSLFHELTVDSIRTESGGSVGFHRGEEASGLWLALAPALQLGERRKLVLYYHGDLLERGSLIPPNLQRVLNIPPERWVFLKSATRWYPRGPFSVPATFDLTFHTPDDISLVSVGRNARIVEEDKVRTTRWTVSAPSTGVSFNLGEFASLEIRDERIPPVTVHVVEEAHRALRRVLYEQDDPLQQVGADIANSLAFFQQTFGEPLAKSFHATEIPGTHGQAFPGLVHLSWRTFQWTEAEGEDELFRAHEVAHQWWGIGVAPASYRDWWLSEGFSEFSGLWYLQMILQDNDLYFAMLQRWKEALLDRGSDVAPVWLGYRVGLDGKDGDYQLIVYKKGGWIMHMLRNMMLDLHTLTEEPFTNMLRDFYTSYRGKRASTDDFRQVVERHMDMPMDWFFDQWVRGTAIPRYRVAHRTEATSDGKFRVHLRIRQERVPADFKMPLPITLDFGNARVARLRVLAEGPLTQVELPLLPLEPQRISVNDFESVLAEVRYERW